MPVRFLSLAAVILALLAAAVPASAEEPPADGAVLISATTLSQDQAEQTYELVAVNPAPTPRQVTVASSAPPARTVVTATPSSGSFDASTGQWTVTLAAGGSASLTLVAL